MKGVEIRVIKKVLYLGLTSAFALSVFLSLVKFDDNAVDVACIGPGDNDDNDDIEKTDEGVMFLSLNTFNLK